MNPAGRRPDPMHKSLIYCMKTADPDLTTFNDPHVPSPSGLPGAASLSLLQAQRHEAQVALRARHQEQRRLAALLLELVEPALQVGGRCDRLLRALPAPV